MSTEGSNVSKRQNKQLDDFWYSRYLFPCSSSKRDKEDITLKFNIRAALKNEQFVVSTGGVIPSTAESFMDPNLPITQCFSEELKHYLPYSSFKEHLPLLRKLGLKKILPSKCIVLCAKNLDNNANTDSIPSNLIKKKPFLL